MKPCIPFSASRRLARFARTVSVGLPLAALAASAAADRIQLTDGRILEGDVIRRAADPQGREQVTIGMPSATITVAADQIKSISVSTPAQKKLIEARDALRVGHYATGIAALNDALAVGAPVEGVAALLGENAESLARHMNIVEPPAREALAKALAAVDASAFAARDDQDEIAEARLWIRLAMDDEKDAEPLLQRLVPKYFEARPDRRAKLARWMTDRIDAAATAKHFAEADALLAPLARIDPSTGDARRVQLELQWAREYREAGQYDQALDIYVHKLFPGSPEIAREYVRTTLDTADRMLGGNDGSQKVIDLYLNYGLSVIPDETRARLIQIHRNAGWRALRSAQYDEARAAFEAAEAVKPGAATKDINQLEYRQRKAKLKDDDLLGYYELGVWANSRQIDDEALEAFQKAENSPIVGDNASAYIGQIMNRRAESDLKHLMDLYDKGQYTDAMNGVYAFKQEGYAPGFQTQADKINELVMSALQLSLSENSQKAQVLYQQAERAFYQERYDEAKEKLESIFKYYKNTVVMGQARLLYVKVHDRQALTRIEQGTSTEPAKADAATSGTTQTTPIGGEIDDLYRSLERIHRDDKRG